MHSQTLISVLVWVAILCLTRVVSDELSELQKSELANKLNMLVRHLGWREGMQNVKIRVQYNGDVIYEPMSVILEAISSNRKPVDESNVLERYKEIFALVLCKYSEIIYWYKILIRRFVRACRHEKNYSFQRYFNCFYSLLSKLHDSSTRFKCMSDALDFLYSLGPQFRTTYNVMIATKKLTKLTLTLRSTAMSKLSVNGNNVDVVDFEIQTISENIAEVYDKIVYNFTYNRCIIQAHKDISILILYEELEHKKSNQLIPQEMTMVEYLEKEIDCFHDEISGNWFYNLGFAYDVAEKVTIGIDLNTITTELPSCSSLHSLT